MISTLLIETTENLHIFKPVGALLNFSDQVSDLFITNYVNSRNKNLNFKKTSMKQKRIWTSTNLSDNTSLLYKFLHHKHQHLYPFSFSTINPLHNHPIFTNRTIIWTKWTRQHIASPNEIFLRFPINSLLWRLRLLNSVTLLYTVHESSTPPPWELA